MKILVSADYHVKLKTKNIPDEWAKDRFLQLFNKLSQIEEEYKIDVHFVMGDFFDRAPTLEELELYYTFVVGRRCKTMIFPGNHEALKKNTTFFTHLKQVTNKLHPSAYVIDDYYSTMNIDVIPYNKLKEFNPDDFHGDLLLTHVRGNIPPHVKSEIDLSLLSRWKTVLAGDLHSYENSQENILYPGSPLTTSFHRKKVDTGVIIFDTETHEHEWVKLDLPQLLRKTIQAGDAMPEDPPHHTIYEVEGDMIELAGMAEHGLLDKKIVKRSTDAALILAPEMSIEQEISEYLEFILGLPEETIERALKTYHDNTTHLKLE